jgi:hypothetical protein
VVLAVLAVFVGAGALVLVLERGRAEVGAAGVGTAEEAMGAAAESGIGEVMEG